MDKREILKQHISKFVSLTDEHLDYFFSHFKEHSFKKGQVIIGEGDKVEKEYFVLTRPEGFLYQRRNKMYILQFAMPTWWTSDYSALYNSTRASINVDCSRTRKCCPFPVRTARRCWQRDPCHRAFLPLADEPGYVASQRRFYPL